MALVRFNWPGGTAAIGPTLKHIVGMADDAGVHGFWLMDHFFQLPMYGAPDDPTVEAYSTLSYLAGVTRNIRLGTLVTCVMHRHPAMLAKTVTTLDVLSGGRARLGIAAGGFDPEHIALGIEWPSWSERFARLEETLQIVHRMWGNDRRPFQGRFFDLAEPFISPGPVQHPRPPILVAGAGERRTLPMVARYGDACNMFEPMGPVVLRQKFDVLRSHCERVGRAYEDIDRTTYGELLLATRQTPRGESVDQVVERFGKLAAAGVDEAIVGLHNPLDEGVFDRLEDVVRQIGPVVPDGRTA
jgi:F420-dependent oxidoreductase-like protein